MYHTVEIYGLSADFSSECAEGGPIVDTTRAAVAYFRDDAAVKYSRIKRWQRSSVNRDALDEWGPSAASEPYSREEDPGWRCRLQPERREISAARGKPERANKSSLNYFHSDTRKL